MARARSSGAGPEPRWREVIGDQLRRLRFALAERLADVAGRAGVSSRCLSEIERGLKDPSSEVLAAVAGALETSVEVAFTDWCKSSHSSNQVNCVEVPLTKPCVGLRTSPLAST